MRQPSLNGISLPYGATSAPYTAANPHAGSDYKYSPDNYWYAPEAVKVSLITVGATCGKQIDFQSLDGRRKYRGCHSAEIYAAVGQNVPEGFRMAKMGATGLAQGAHLHLVMWVDGVRVDPYKTIESLKGGSAVLDDNLTKSIFKGYLRREATQADLAYWRGKPVGALTTNLENTSAYAEVNTKVVKSVVNEGDVTNLFVSLFARKPTAEEIARDANKKLWHDWWYAYGQAQGVYLNKKVAELSKGYTKVTEDLYRKVT